MAPEVRLCVTFVCGGTPIWVIHQQRAFLDPDNKSTAPTCVSWKDSPTSSTTPPSLRTFATLISGVLTGMQIRAVQPCRRGNTRYVKLNICVFQRGVSKVEGLRFQRSLKTEQGRADMYVLQGVTSNHGATIQGGAVTQHHNTLMHRCCHIHAHLHTTHMVLIPGLGCRCRSKCDGP